MIHVSRRALLLGVTAGMLAARFVIASLGWSRMIHAFAAPLGRLWPQSHDDGQDVS
jgi:hypothetical protein